MSDRTTLADRPRLTTGNLVLRCPDEGDIGDIIDAVGNWEVARCLSRVPHPYGERDARFFLEHVVPGEWIWAITRAGADRLIGVVGLTPPGSRETAELGYWLGQPYWGRGIVTAAARAVVSFGFDQLSLPSIRSAHFVDNPASGRVLQKLGFVETGRSMLPCLALNTQMPSVEMRLESGQRPHRAMLS